MRALQYLGLDEDKNSVGFDGLKVNLIMTDYSMPGMTGFELLQKSSSKLREIPVVIMSSENMLARIDRCLEEGAEDFLVKPVKRVHHERRGEKQNRNNPKEKNGRKHVFSIPSTTIHAKTRAHLRHLDSFSDINFPQLRQSNVSYVRYFG